MEVGGVHVLDRVVGVDDEGVAIGDAVRRAHAEAVNQRALGVGELPDRQLVQVPVIAPPGELAELVVGRAAQHHGVAVLEVLRQAGEFGDLSRADEGEVLRIEEDDLPLARKTCLAQRLERALSLFFLSLKSGLHADHLKRWQLGSNSKHSVFQPSLKTLDIQL